jgi:hypothetical protein
VTGQRVENIDRARDLLGAARSSEETAGTQMPDDRAAADLPPCPCCGSPLRIIETFLRGETPTQRPTHRPLVFRIDTS